MTCHIGDCRQILPVLPTVQMCVTSPPYWGLRDYGVDGQLGLEPTPEEYVENMVEVFRLVRDVLADNGTLWLNMGDCYHSGDRGGYRHDGHRWEKSELQKGNRGNAITIRPNRMKQVGLKDKDLVGMPWRLAFALQADGWYLRSDIIWHKPNPMPESVTDRPTKAHEYLFLLSKQAKYYYDAEAIREPYLPQSQERAKYVRSKSTSPQHHQPDNIDVRYLEKGIVKNNDEGRNKRSVWTISTQPYADAHFATFPEALIEPCILAGSRSNDVVLDPFFGSGTVGEVCERLGRKWIGIELNPEYVKLAERRTAQQGLSLG